jgi:ribosomal protein S18 acetylase RimI-like enzyme
MLIRPATDNDVPHLAAIRAREWQSEQFWRQRIGGYLRGVYSPGKAEPPRAIFVAIEEDSSAGFVAGHASHRFACQGELQWIDVVWEYRRRGIARALACQMGAWFVQQGLSRVCVNVAPENEAARRLYASLGAQPLGFYWMLWPDVAVMTAKN